MLSHTPGVWRTCLLACSACLITAACAPAAGRFAVHDSAADANTPAAASTYRSVLRGYTSNRPVEPRPWREQNDRVAPETKP